MIKLNYTLPLLISAVCFSTSANATIVVTGNLSYDDSSDIITSASGPQYASWDTLAGSTYTEMLSATNAGGAFESFHIANQAEAFQFYQDAIPTLPTIIDNPGQTVSIHQTSATGSPFGNNFISFSDVVFFITSDPTIAPYGIIEIFSSSGELQLNDNFGDLTRVNNLSTANNASWLLVSDTSPVPVPAAVWLMGSGLLGLMGYSRNRKADTVAA